VEALLCHLFGVQAAQANGLTKNVVIRFDRRVTGHQSILTQAAALTFDAPAPSRDRAGEVASSISSVAAPSRPRRRPSIHRTRQGQTVRARITVPGMDRRPHLAGHVSDHFASRHPAVRTRVNMLTGRILVEFEEHEEDLDDLVAEITGMDLPEVPDEDQPSNPLDPGPLIQASARTLGAALGLVLISARGFFGIPRLIDAAVAVQGTAVAGIVSGLPFVRTGLRRSVGRDAADLLLSLPVIIGLALSETPLGLLLSGAEGLRLLTEVVTRRAAWRRFEERLLDVPPPVPGTVICLQQGEQVPLAAKVIEGTGTATGRDGLPVRVAPGELVSAGARVYGGTFTLELQAPAAFEPAERPAPVGPSLYSRYERVLTPLSLGYALLTGLVTGSVTRTLESLLLVSPRTAVIGMEAAEIGASARVLRAGVTIVGTRRERPIRMPNVLLLDGPRLLASGFELAAVVPQDEQEDVSNLTSLAAAIAQAVQSPWGNMFPADRQYIARDGIFDGATANAAIDGTTYSLGPIPDGTAVPESLRMRSEGSYLLQLRREPVGQTLGFFIVRPRMAAGVTELLQTCQRHGVEVELLSAGTPIAAMAMASRLSVPLLGEVDALEVIRLRQSKGLVVTFVSDGAHAGEAFEACDLAIGMADVRSHLPARADLMAPNLAGVAAIVEVGARGERATRGSVLLSLTSNLGGAILGFRGEVGVETASNVSYLSSLAAVAWDWLMLRQRLPHESGSLPSP
jgi:cation transport ATPase